MSLFQRIITPFIEHELLQAVQIPTANMEYFAG